MADRPPVAIVIGGPAGSGKSTVGRRLAESLGWPFLEGDDLHAPASIEKMRRGEGLSDADRQPWLERLRDAIREQRGRGTSLVATCSCLKARYRQVVAGADGASVLFVMLQVDPMVLHERLTHRLHHFAGAALLESQLAALEPATDAIVVEGQGGPERQVAAIRQVLRTRGIIAA